MLYILLSIFAALFAIYFYVRTRKPKNFPPGPPRLPILGSFPFMNGPGEKPSLLLGLSEEIKKHGPIVGFYYGSTPAVFLTDFDTIKEVFKNEAVTARPDFHPYEQGQPGFKELRHIFNRKVQGVIFSHGPYWKEMRRFLARNLRDFGFGKTSMEDLFVEEVAKLCEALAKTSGHPVELSASMNISVINALWSILTGDKFDLEDKKLHRVVENLNNFIKKATVMSPVTALLPSPDMATWPIINKITGYKITKDALSSIGEMVMPYIDEHVKTLDSENIRDFLDLMLLEHKNATDINSCFYGEVGKYAVINSMIDLFIGGMESTVNSLLMIILHVLHYPEVQRKVHEEIDKVTGNTRFPSFEDRKELHYVNAVLQESFRVCAVVHFAVPHCTTDEVKVGGYTLPKGTIVMPSLYHAMHDPKFFKDPDVFRPERFIDANGKFIFDEHVIPFCVGKRICLGHPLAEKQFFYFFTGLLQQFQISLAPGETLPSYIDIYPGSEVLIRGPPHFKVVLTKRKV